jgi:hypothetical protein
MDGNGFMAKRMPPEESGSSRIILVNSFFEVL